MLRDIRTLVSVRLLFFGFSGFFFFLFSVSLPATTSCFSEALLAVSELSFSSRILDNLNYSCDERME